ncbi:DUF2213 domain-containing protein [Morganella morganii]|uniref:DUF2213 domain-containing protein n=2 Tax=Gammaproteobacteria TaxID=1236 RepID=UPI001BDB72E7|nr:DUF2213 domain-containing protein [Morganella morganii]MBT0498754.1 DUF2213 domain-containing protein [Morganella morganii subsp. morganii]QWL98020.1 DUF2213 domain-containing protein [Morganella morganii subsp. morganii]
MKRTRVNVLSAINSSSNISIETINNVEHYVVKNVCPLYDDCVLNEGLYPTAENDKGYKSLDRVPMPYGHPKVNGNYVTARDVDAINEHYIGAYSANPRKENGRVLIDMYVNKRFAEGSESGREVIERLDKMMNGEDVEPIGISTGLNLNRLQANGKAPNGKKYKWIATNQQYDHIAILLHEQPAGTPEEGIGVFVNSEGEKLDVEEVKLIDAANFTQEGLFNKAKFFFANNSFSFEDIYSALRAALRNASSGDDWPYPETVWPDKFIYYKSGKTYQQKYLIDDNGAAEFVGEPIEVVRKPTEYEVKTNKENEPMKQIITNALKAKGIDVEGKTDAELLDAYNQMNADASKAEEAPEEKAAREKKEKEEKEAKDKAANGDMQAMITAAVNAAVAPLQAQLNASADKEKTTMREAVKTKFGMSDVAVNSLDGDPLKELYAQCAPVHGLNGSFHSQQNASTSVSEMPE